MRIKIENKGDDLNGLFMYLFSYYPETYIRQIVDVSASSTFPWRPEPFTAINTRIRCSPTKL